VDREPTREQRRQGAFQVGAEYVAAGLVGSADQEAEAAAALLPAALSWLRAEVRETTSGALDATEPQPREALRTLLIILEELQRLLPLAIASLVDDALADGGVAPAGSAGHRARGDLLSRRLLTEDELASWPRGTLITVAVQRFRALDGPGGFTG
jgi:hypothetical protein